MKHGLLILIGLFVVAGAQGQSSKRGMAYGHHSASDMEVLAPNVSWWYNWSETPESSVAEVYGDYGFEFVPMTWNGKFDETKLRDFLSEHPETKYLLAFNEPNFLEQAKMTPTEVAAQWPRLEAIADEFNLEIVAPAVNYCGDCVSENGTTYTDPFDYLDDFFAACPDCRVDYIAVHCYMNTVSALQWYIDQFKKYEKPIWLTEFAGWEDNNNINNISDQINFMIGAVDFLESDPDVFRYAWFIGRGDGINSYPYIDLLGTPGTLTPLGEIYTQMPIHDENHVVAIPATIEAEAYNKMSGILLEQTSDNSGFANVGYLDGNDWLEYKIEVDEAGNYPIRFRVASTKNTGLQVFVDEELALTQSISNTNGWQSWQTFENTIDLTSGEHTIRLVAVDDGFNFNWLKIGNITGVEPALENPDQALNVYPNPGTGYFHIESSVAVARLEVVNLTGAILQSMEFERTIDLSDLTPGLYFLKAENEKGSLISTQRIIIQK